MTDSLVARARAVLETERQALDTALDRAPEQVAAAARLILDREPADVIVTGVGKSGHIAHKLAATSAVSAPEAISIGRPKCFTATLGPSTKQASSL